MGKKKAILMAATKLFAQKGFTSTTTSEIAKKAGVAEGTIFHHYKNKDNILITILKQVIDDYLFGVRQSIKHSESGIASIKNILIFYFNFIKKRENEFLILNRDIPIHLISTEGVYGNEIMPQIQKIVKEYQRCLRRGISDGSIRKLNVEKVGLLLDAFLIGFTRLELLRPEIPTTLSVDAIDFIISSLSNKM